MNVSTVRSTVLAAIRRSSWSVAQAPRRIRNTAFLGALLLSPALLATPPASMRDAAPEGMVWIPAGESTMGWDGPEARYDEGPAHRVHVDGFFMDATEVTNAQFRAFVEATGYRTTAERPVDWEQMKKQVAPGTEAARGTARSGRYLHVARSTHRARRRERGGPGRPGNWRQPEVPVRRSRAGRTTSLSTSRGMMPSPTPKGKRRRPRLNGNGPRVSAGTASSSGVTSSCPTAGTWRTSGRVCPTATPARTASPGPRP